MKEKIDFLIVGAGFSGMTAAQRLSEAGFKCVVVDKRAEVGGNAVERKDANGTVYHPYGPHIFQSSSARIIDYLSRFTEWQPVNVTVSSLTQGRHWSFPPNLETYEQLVGRDATEEEFVHWLRNETVHPGHVAQDAEAHILATSGRTFYEMFFRPYIQKMWGRHPSQLFAQVGARVPVHTARDRRYLPQGLHALPSNGYAGLFANMRDASPNLEIALGVTFKQAREVYAYQHIVFTGPIDEYFGWCLGPLPYRSLAFQVESFAGRDLVQPTAVVATPDADTRHTRHTELGHLTGQRGSTCVVHEIPMEWGVGAEPHYPIPCIKSYKLLERYNRLAQNHADLVTFTGRLGAYRYFNMDQAVGQAMATAARVAKRHTPG